MAAPGAGFNDKFQRHYAAFSTGRPASTHPCLPSG